MASITWSGTFGGNSAGSSGKTTTLSASSTLPSNATISSVTYRLKLTSGGYSSSKHWRLYWLIAESSSGTKGAYIGSEGSSTVVKSTSMSSTSVTLTGSLTLSNNAVFQSKTITCSAKANTDHSSTSYMREVSVTVTYTIPSLTWSATLDATQINNQIKLSWATTPSYSGGSGSCVYAVNNGTEWVVTNLSSSTTSYTLIPTTYGTEIQYIVEARYSGLMVRKTIKITASPPTITWDSSVFMITETEESQLLIEWGEATGMYGASGSAISYKLYSAASPTATSSLVGTYDVNNATIDQPAKDTYYYIIVSYGSTTSTGPRHYYAAHRTVKRWNGSSWDELIVYCFQGSTWVECIPYRWNGSSWDLLSH